MNRREFAGALAAAAAAVSMQTFARPLAGAQSSGTLPLHVVYDTRVLERNHAGTHGAAMEHPFSGDVTRVWFDILHGLWRDRAIATLGITRPAEFFVLSTLARDQAYVVDYAEEFDGGVNWLVVPRR